MVSILDLLIFAAPITLVYFIIRLSLFKIFRINWIKESIKTSFIFYISTLVFIVWIYGPVHTQYLLYNIIPFKSIVSYVSEMPSNIAIKNLLGNILICIPLGFYYYFKFRVFAKLNILVYAVFIPVIIEFIQLLLFVSNLGMRTVDIDDVILNCTGILIGYYMTQSLFQKNLATTNAT